MHKGSLTEPRLSRLLWFVFNAHMLVGMTPKNHILFCCGCVFLVVFSLIFFFVFLFMEHQMLCMQKTNVIHFVSLLQLHVL